MAEIHCFPSLDASFASDAVATLTRLGERATADALEQALREVHPFARVTERNALAVVGESSPTWYVFRDGGV
jgi:hypothetical protein